MNSKTYTSMSIWISCYRILLRVLSPIWRLLLNQRLKRGKETIESINQKLMLKPAVRPDGLLVWGHAVGVGEALALASLFSQLASLLPNHHFLITSSANTSAQVLQAGQLPDRCVHQFSPIDTPAAVQRFLNHWRPCLAIWCEMDIWPCLMSYTYQQRIPMILVNARLSDYSYQKKQYVKRFYESLLIQFSYIYCQNDTTRERLISLGADSKIITVVGSIKQISPPLRCDLSTLETFKSAIGNRPCWLLASSHQGEEEIAIKAHALIIQRIPNALLLIAPRYPKRGHELALQFNLLHAQRSKGALPNEQSSMYLCDTIGEMGLWYRLGSIALIGGSLIRVGGHNPYEALTLNCAVVHGPHTSNFEECYTDLDELGQTKLVTDAREIADTVLLQLSKPKRTIFYKKNALLQVMIDNIKLDLLKKYI